MPPRRTIAVPNSVDMVALISKVRDHVPPRKSDRYINPTETEAAEFRKAAGLAAHGDVDTADSLLNGYGYDAVASVDRHSGAS